MEFNLIGNTLVLSGAVVDTDLAKARNALDPTKVKLIVMHHNAGGDLLNAIRIGEIIRDSGIPTTISGLCISACGLIYLGGKNKDVQRWKRSGKNVDLAAWGDKS